MTGKIIGQAGEEIEPNFDYGDIKQRDSISHDEAQYWEINNDFIKQVISSFKEFL